MDGNAAESSGVDRRRKVYLLGGALADWLGAVAGLQQAGIELKPVPSSVDVSALVIEVQRETAVVVIDLDPDEERSVGLIAAFRSCPGVPVVAAVRSPSIELARRLRAAGVFAIVVHPIDTARLCETMEKAFRKLESPAGSAATRKVLVIDDDVDFRSSVSSLLTSEGYNVRCAVTGSEGLAMAVAEKPDLIILDIMMENEWAGYEVNQTIKFQTGYESVRRTPILMVSSIPDHPVDRFQRSEEPTMVCPDLYMTKPIDIPAFLDNVRRLLKGVGGEQA